MQAPPSWVVDAVERAAPGFARWFARAGSLGWERAGRVTVTSWWRSSEWNREVGGSDTSQHLIGAAFDVVASDYSRAAAAFRGAGFRTVFEGDHLHVQVWPAGAASGLIRSLRLA